MASEVVYFSNKDVMKDASNQNAACVAALEELLQKAKDGEVVGIAYAVQYQDRSAGNAAAGFLFDTQIIGCLTRQIHRIIANG